jgi:dCTP deaminase
MISPFVDHQVRTHEDGEKAISYGLSSYGYDVRLASEHFIFTNVDGGVINPKNFDHSHYVARDSETIIIPPHGFILGKTIEHFKIPRDVITICLGKSTYARCGISVIATPFEPEFEGQIVLEFANHTPLPVMLFANEGCAQIMFFAGTEDCEVSYADRGGKYQGQTGITLAKG